MADWKKNSPDQPLQNFATFRFGLVQPMQRAGSLSAGVYTLSCLGNAPFITLKGLSGGEKVYTWGEIIEVPHGNMVTVWNASYHEADIVISSGRDYAALPKRVTVPVGMIQTGDVAVAAFPVDTRRARAAWLAVDANSSAGGPATITTIVQARERSVNIVGYASGPQVTTINTIPANTQFGYIPLGSYTSIPWSDPMSLLDVAIAQLVFTPAGFANPAAFYVLEY